jgi:hypothetical protein
MFTINLLPSLRFEFFSSLAQTTPVVDASAGIWVVCLVDIGSHIHLGCPNSHGVSHSINR